MACARDIVRSVLDGLNLDSEVTPYGNIEVEASGQMVVFVFTDYGDFRELNVR